MTAAPAVGGPTLASPAEIFDAAGYRAAGGRLLDLLAAHFAGAGERPAWDGSTPERLWDRLRQEMPQGSASWEQLEEDVRFVLAHANQFHHPRYMGHQVCPPLHLASLLEPLVSTLNQSQAVWEMSPVGTLVERLLVSWLGNAAGMPATAAGTVVSGGTAATLTALAAAREHAAPGSWRHGLRSQPRLVVFAGESAHYSVERAAGLLGLGCEAVRGVAEDGEGRMRPDVLARLIGDTRSDGEIPLAVVATAGSTAVGAFDDLVAIGEVARAESVWLHVDGAHGASALLSERLAPLLEGVAKADSLSWDPHKLMFMPLSLGLVLVRDGRRLQRCFSQSAPYLFHPRQGELADLDLGERSLQCSRRSDAIKLWLCLRYYGSAAFGAWQEQLVTRAEQLWHLLEATDDFETLHRPQSNILCWRAVPPGARSDERAALTDEFNAALRAAYNSGGDGWITTTRWRGRQVLRAVVMNPRTSADDLAEVVRGLRATAGRLLTEPRFSALA